jgi:DNA-binding response OmpR family regulator
MLVKGMVKKIMVVDDEASIVHTVKRGIEGMDKDYEIIAVSNGRDCLKLLEEDQIPDLILLDIMMPEMSGWETYNQIKANDHWKNIPVVFLTARTDRIARDAGGFLGDDYIEKPFNVPDLKARIDKILKR